MTDQCHDRGPHAWENVVIANTLILGGEFVQLDDYVGPSGFWSVHYDGGGSTPWRGSKYRAGIDFLKEHGFYVTWRGNLERCP